MDPFDPTVENPPDRAPTPEVTQRHRAQLAAAIDADRRARRGTGHSDGGAPGRVRRPARALTVAVAIVAGAAVVGVTMAVLSGGDSRPGTDVQATAAEPGSTATSAPQACSTPPPRQLAPVAGFSNPVAVSDPDAPVAASASQQVTTWKSATGSLETRWPADVALQQSSDAAIAGNGGAAGFLAVATARTSTKSGLSTQTVVFVFPDQPSGCSALQVTVYDPDPARVAAIVDDLTASPLASTTPTVTARNTAAVFPTVVACAVPAGMPAVPNRSGTVNTDASASPDDALVAFLGADRTLLRDGYTQVALPDGSYVYTREVQPGVVVTSVHATAVDGRWTISDWSASGC